MKPSQHEPSGVHWACRPHEYGQVSGRVRVDVALDQPDRPLVLPAQLARRAIERCRADEAEGIVQTTGDGVDAGEVEFFAGGAAEILKGKGVGGGQRGGKEAEGVEPEAAGEAVLAMADEDEVGTGGAEQCVVARGAADGVVVEDDAFGGGNGEGDAGVGLDRVRVKLSLSSGAVSAAMARVIFWLVWPGAKVMVPPSGREAAAKSAALTAVVPATLPGVRVQSTLVVADKAPLRWTV